ncbi:MAG: STAS domain-containing protein [Myxococcales bacterium]|nr:MAG: STAS domain-containing protein [Myxococcales bacterium]
MSDERGGIAKIPLQISRNCIIASIQIDLSDAVLRQFRTELLELVQSSGAHGVILDVSGIEVMDYEDFEALHKTMAMARLMGAPSVLAGLQAGVVSSLVELEAETEDIVAAMDLDDAFRVMDQLRATTDRDNPEDEQDERLQVAAPNQL